MKNKFKFIVDFLINGVFALSISAALVFLTAASMIIWGKAITISALLIGTLGFIGLTQSNGQKSNHTTN